MLSQCMCVVLIVYQRVLHTLCNKHDQKDTAQAPQNLPERGEMGVGRGPPCNGALPDSALRARQSGALLRQSQRTYDPESEWEALGQDGSGQQEHRQERALPACPPPVWPARRTRARWCDMKLER